MKLSIVTINFNNLDGLKKTIESVNGQKYQDFEYIVIDGASTDGSKELVEQSSKKLAYWQSTPDKGVYDAMNLGIAHAKGEYVMFLNSGDYLLQNDSLEQFFAFMPDTDIVYGDAVRMNDKGTLEPYTQPDILSYLFFYRYSLCHQSMMYKRELFEKYGSYRTDLKIVSDWAYNLKMFMTKSVTWRHIAVPIVYYDTRGISSTDTTLLDQEREQVLREVFTTNDLEKIKKEYSLRQSLLGKIFIKLGILKRW